MVVRPSIRLLSASDPEPIAAAFAAIGWDKPAAQYERYLEEQARGTRTVLVATEEGAFAGYLAVVWSPEYAPFQAAGIPEIQDLNVLPQHRRRGIATALMVEAEALVGRRSAVVGIGFGMDPDYGAAQRLYVLRGYVPDGRGLTYRDMAVKYGDYVRVDDDLALHLTKRLSA